MLKYFKISFNILVIAMMLMLSFIWFRKNEAFFLKTASIQGNQFLTRDEILELASIDFSNDLFDLNLEEIEKRICKNPIVEQVKITKIFPSGIKIKIKEHDLIAVAAGSEISAIDISGDVISKFPTKAVYDLPIITGLHFYYDSTGARFAEKQELVDYTSEVLKQLKAIDLLLYYEISELNYHSKRGIVIYLKDSNLPVLLGKESIDQKLIYFSTIYHHLINQSCLDQALAIDIRFKDQVIVKQKT